MSPHGAVAAAAAARRLGGPERAALLWLPADGSERRFAEVPLALALRRLRHRGFCAQRIVVPGYETVWRATPEGLALRDAVLAAEARAGGAGDAAGGPPPAPPPRRQPSRRDDPARPGPARPAADALRPR